MSAADGGSAPRRASELFRPTTRVRRAARLLLQERFLGMWACLPAALAGEPEAGIHEMRIGAKRLREAMELMRRAYHAADYERLLADVDSLNDRLGLVRDADALVELLDDLFGAAPPPPAALREAVVQRRQTDLAALIEHLRGLADSGFEARFAKSARDGRHSKGHKLAGQSLAEFAPMAVGRRLVRVVRRLREIPDERAAEALHRARVANKHLRYVMEAFLAIYDRRFAEAYRRVVELHKVLGDLHDLDILAQRLTKQAGDDPAAAGPLLEVIERRRVRECGRFESYRSPEAITAFGQAVIDCLD
jgi:CHAD domain-containing protein